MVDFDMIDLFCHEKDELFPDDGANYTFDFDEFVEWRTKILTAESYQTPPMEVMFDIKRVEKRSSSDSGVYNNNNNAGPSPKFRKPCLCIKERGDVKLSDFFHPRPENIQPLYRPFDSLPKYCDDFLASWQENYKRLKGGDVLEPVPQVHEENSIKAGMDYITEAKNYFSCSDKTFYVAMKYFNAYILRNKWENWGGCNCSIVLLCSTCLSLAAKMEEHDNYPYMASPFRFPKSVVTEMEVQVWKSCDWRLWLTTPFEILDIIVCEKADNAMERNDLYSRASQLILAFGITDNGLVEVAFAGLLAVTHGQSITKEQVEECVLSFKQFTNVDTLSCLDIIRKMGNPR